MILVVRIERLTHVSTKTIQEPPEKYDKKWVQVITSVDNDIEEVEETIIDI